MEVHPEKGRGKRVGPEDLFLRNMLPRRVCFCKGKGEKGVFVSE